MSEIPAGAPARSPDTLPNGGPPAAPQRFTLLSRLLHWVMAAMVLTMLFMGVAMVASVEMYDALAAVHRPLGVLILVLVVVRFVNRLRHRAPPCPSTMRRPERVVATGSEYLMYALMFAQPLVGWGMLSAAGNVVVIHGPLRLPPIVPADPGVYAALREAHTVLAHLLFAVVTAHLCAVLFHAFVVRDGIHRRMTFGRAPRGR